LSQFASLFGIFAVDIVWRSCKEVSREDWDQSFRNAGCSVSADLKVS
jgi:hypothetical protein